MDSDKLDLSVLIIEDDEVTLEMLQYVMEEVIERVYTAKNGAEALEIYRHNNIELILTDNQMPEMKGVEFVKLIREVDPNIPIIVITANSTEDDLIDFINNDVTYLLKKPIDIENLLSSLKKAIKKNIYHSLEQKAKEQDLDLLKTQFLSDEKQKQKALRKLVLMKKDDLYLRKLPKHYLNIGFNPAEILSSDTYSIIKKNGKIYFGLFDAIEQGVNAAINAILSTSYFLTTISRHIDFQAFCFDYINILKTRILADDRVALHLIEYDEENQKMKYAFFGTPPMIIDDKFIESNNKELTLDLDTINIDEVDIHDFNKMIIYTTGIGFNIEKEKIKEFLLNSPTKKSLHEKIETQLKKLNKKEDITYLELFRLDNSKIVTDEKFNIPATLSDVLENIEAVKNTLNISFKEEIVDNFLFSYKEIIMNSLIYGEFKITEEEKNSMNKEEFMKLLETKSSSTYIKSEISIYNYEDEFVIKAKIIDNGNGFDPKIITKGIVDPRYDYRDKGIRKALKYAEIFYNDKANEAELIKTIKKDK